MPEDASAVMDHCLSESSLGYKGIRAMNELDIVKVFGVPKGTFSDYQEYCQKKGMRMEQAKIVRVLKTRKQIEFFRAASRKKK